MSLINDEEILARIHKFKLFRKEGSLYLDVYEAILGKPGHGFIAVPNIIVQEAEAKYFGVGDSIKAALKDCLGKIKDIPIHSIVPTDALEGPHTNTQGPSRRDEEPELSPASWKPYGILSGKEKKPEK